MSTTPNQPTEPIDVETLASVAFALLQAAVLLRDIASAAPRQFLESMPPDIGNRLFATYYQDAFDKLPEAVKAVAREAVLADADVSDARRIDRRTI